MLLSISMILLIGLALGWVCEQLHLPRLLGMLGTGILLGPYVWDLIDSSILELSTDLRKIALIIILVRAGLTLELSDLKKVGRPAVLMCFVPAVFEIFATTMIAPLLLDLTRGEAALLGTVIAAVSPAVIVPKMIKLMENGYGTKKGIPQLILAGASVDDVFVIVMFYAMLSFNRGEEISPLALLNIPVSIALGMGIGFGIGTLLGFYFRKIHMRDTVKVIIFTGIAFVLVAVEDFIPFEITFSALVAVMFMGMGLRKKRKEVAQRLATKFSKLWVCAEIMLFVLVGASVNIHCVRTAGVAALAVIAVVLVVRMVGVLICLIRTKLNVKEKVFCAFSYIPKATVQAAIGGIPLSMGLACGDMILTAAVLAILVTAPVGAFLIEASYRRLLEKS